MRSDRTGPWQSGTEGQTRWLPPCDPYLRRPCRTSIPSGPTQKADGGWPVGKSGHELNTFPGEAFDPGELMQLALLVLPLGVPPRRWGW